MGPLKVLLKVSLVATTVYPDTTDELISYLGDNEPRVTVLAKTFDFTGSEGTTTITDCAPWGIASACQIAISQDDWCTNYEPDTPTTTVTYDNAGILGIAVASDKTLLGEGSTGIIKGKGLRMVSSVSNIIQNIFITDINPKYVWSGDAITADMIWIDHVTVHFSYRPSHIVLGTSASNRVTISNSEINGVTDCSTTCDGYRYWSIYLDGSNDLVTLKGNYIYHTSGRSPKIQGKTLLHPVNNYWYDNSGYAFEIGEGAYVGAEGNVFQNVDVVVEDPIDGEAFIAPSTSANAAYSAYLGHVCQVNGFGSSGTFSADNTSFFDFEGKNVASVFAYTTVVSCVTSNASYGKINY